MGVEHVALRRLGHALEPRRIGQGADDRPGQGLRVGTIHQEAVPETGSENAMITVPAELPGETRERIHETARTIYTALGCEGLARVDMFLREDGRIVLNEVNTLPGFTTYSRYPRMMAAAGISLSDVIDRCIALAMAR